MADKKTIEDLREDEIKDLYSAEKQLTRAISKMAKGSSDPALQTASKDHLKETEGRDVWIVMGQLRWPSSFPS